MQRLEKNSRISVFCVTEFWCPKIGGMERSIDNHCRSLLDKFDMCVLTRETNINEKPDLPYMVYELPSDGENDFYPFAFDKIKKVRSACVVHVFGFSFFAPESQAHFIQSVAKLPDTTVVFKVPTSGDVTRYMSSTHSTIKNSVDYFIALNNSIAKELVECHVTEGQIKQISNGVRTDFFRPDSTSVKKNVRSQFGIPNNCLTVGFCGRFERRKRLDVLASAIYSLSVHDSEKVNLLLVGYVDDTFGEGVGGEEFSGKNIFKHPKVKDIRPFYYALDIYVSASEKEGMSNAILEAMACGLPIIASDIPGHTELVRHRKNGLLYELENVFELSECIKLALEKKQSDEVKRWGQASRKIAIKKFDQKIIAKSYENIYQGK